MVQGMREAYLLAKAADLLQRELDEDSGCDHAVNICSCGLVSYIEDLRRACNLTSRDERARYAEDAIMELERAAAGYEDSEPYVKECYEVIAALKAEFSKEFKQCE